MSKTALQCATSPHEAAKATKQLIGCWPHAKPPDPATYSAAVAAVLAGYPLGVVQECCDPRGGLASTREFPPTIAVIVSWCDVRLAWHQSVAAWKPRPAELPAPTFTEEHCADMRERIAGIPNKYFKPVQAAE